MEEKYILDEMVKLRLLFTNPSFLITKDGIEVQDAWTNLTAKTMYYELKELYQLIKAKEAEQCYLTKMGKK